MGISMIPGWYDQIAPYVQQLSGIIPRIMNPHLDQQKYLMQQIAQNPQILQQLSDLNANNPGIIDKLGFGNISGQIGKLPESYKSKTEKIKNQALQNLTPDQQTELTSNLIGIHSPEERARLGLQDENLRLGIKSQQQNLMEGDIKLAEQNRVKNLEGQFSEWYSQQPKGTNLYAARRDNSVPEWLSDAIVSSPKVAKQYDQDAQTYFQEQNLTLERRRIELQKIGNRQSYDEWLRKSLQDQAERKAYEVGSNNINGFATLISNPMLTTQLKNLDPNQLNSLAQQRPDMAGAIDAFKSQQSFFNAKDAKDKLAAERLKQATYGSLRAAHQDAINKLQSFGNGKATELDVQAAVDSYNQRVSEGISAGINAGLLKYDVKPGAKRDAFGPHFITGDTEDTRKTLVLVNPNSGQVVGDGTKSFEVPDPTKSKEFTQQIDKVVIDLVSRNPVDRKKILDQLAADTTAAGKVAYAQISAKVKSGGLQVSGEIKPGTDKVKTEAPKPQVNPTLADSAKASNKTAADLAEYMKQYSLANKNDKEYYLNEWKKELNPNDYAKLRYMLGIK